ncbi:phosphoribosyl-AMP cyclohydrolase [Botrimarina hoheduenensis]|nr:phosphoribosyl-AMP cyclohydrolase [Botrimarina hoheduenensis]
MAPTPIPPDPAAPVFADTQTLLPVIAQDDQTGEVLMLAYMNREAYEETLRTGQAVYYSRSREALWRKGDTSGHVQRVRAILLDCDRDTILLRVEQVGAGACHEGYRSCFFRQVTPEGLRVVAERVYDPNITYGPG